MNTQMTFQDVHASFSPLFSDLKPHIVDAFLTYHKENPEIYQLFKRFASEARARWEHFGAGAIVERIRWETNARSADGQFKINNNFRSCYARLLIFEDPSFKEFFEVRKTPGTVS